MMDKMRKKPDTYTGNRENLLRRISLKDVMVELNSLTSGKQFNNSLIMQTIIL